MLASSNTPQRDGSAFSMCLVWVKRSVFLSVLWVSSLPLISHPAFSQTTSPKESLQKALILYQLYAVADDCTKLGLVFSETDMDGISSVVEQRISELGLTDDERTKIWSAVQQVMQIKPVSPSYCVEARQWFGINLPEVFAGGAEEKPF